MQKLTNFLVQLEEDLIVLGNEQITKELTEWTKETCKEYGLCTTCFAELTESLSSIDGDITVSCECSTRTYKYGGVGI